MKVERNDQKKSKIVPNVSWTLVGNLTYAFTQFLILSVIAKIGGPEEVGVFALALAIVSPIFLFLNVKLRTVIVTDIYNDYRFIEYYFLRGFTSIIALIIIMLITIGMNYSLYVTSTILMVSFGKVFEMRIDLFYGYLQKKSFFNLIAKSTIIRGILNLLVITLIYAYSRNLVFAFLGQALVNALMSYFYDGKTIRKHYVINRNYTKVRNYYKIKELFLLALPLGISTIIGSLNINLPRYIIEIKLGFYELGIFAGITYLLVVGGTFLNAVSQVMIPKLSKLAGEKNYTEFLYVLKQMIIVGFSVGTLLLLIFFYWGDYVLLLLYSKEYLEYKNVMLIIVSGSILLYSTVFLGTAITALKKFKIQPIIHVISLFFVVISALLLIEKYELTGMAWSIVIGYLITSLGYIISIFLIIKSEKNVDRTNI